MKLGEIREALEKVSMVDWKASYCEGTQFPYMNIMGRDCVTVVENAPQWLASLVSQVEEMQKTLEWYADEENWHYDKSGDGLIGDGGDHARKTLQSLKENKP